MQLFKQEKKLKVTVSAGAYWNLNPLSPSLADLLLYGPHDHQL